MTIHAFCEDEPTMPFIEVLPTPRQLLFELLDSVVSLGGSLTLYAADYAGDLAADFLRWTRARPQYELAVSESRVVCDTGWQRLITADQPRRGHMRAFSIYFPAVPVPVLDLEG